MVNFNIDRLKFRWKGNWLTETQYTKDDIVYYNGKAYVCLQEHTSTTFFNDNYTTSDITFNVIVSTDTLNGSSQGKFYVNGLESPDLNLTKGKTYIFNQNNETNDSNPLLLSSVVDGELNGGIRFNNGIKYYLNDLEVTEENYISNFSSATTREIRFTVPLNISNKIYYYSANNKNMGNVLNTRYDSNWEIMFDGSAWKSNWTSEEFYTEGSIVKYYGNLYKCVNAHTSTINLTTDISNWILFASGFNWLNEWTDSTDYSIGDVVRYNGNTYICNETHTSTEVEALGLENDQSKWTVVVISDNWKSDWETFTRYIVNDIVKYGAIVYRCIEAHTSSTTINNGLEADQSKWEIVNSGIEYKENWESNIKYRKNDIVKYGSSLWKCNQGHVSTLENSQLRFDQEYWDIWIPGLHYERQYDNLKEYSQGDIVLFGGYSYVALRNNLNKNPGIDINDWELITTNYNLVGDWSSTQNYQTGDVVRSGGSLYIAISNNISSAPELDSNLWKKIVEADFYKSTWHDNTEYFNGDMVIYKGILYKCINYHISTESDSRPDLDVQQPDQDYWQVLIESTPNNVLSKQGDLKTYNQELSVLSVGNSGEVVQVENESINYFGYEQIPNVFYVGTDGLDVESSGRTMSSPFKTIKYACDYVRNNISVETNNVSIFVKTGYYEEELPIRVPKNTVLIGDELRSTTVSPLAGFETLDMFYVNNGSGLRNMTLQGLNGTLGPRNQYLTQRPTGGAFVSLDPGSGPTDESVWITTKSCYVQNVSAFGTGCVGMKVDGSLHNGGNKSIVANDFTQIISDGIGYWATNQGRSELVSVFTYYCHIGYLAENGGILRATNGNNSYGTYGSIAEGFDPTEIPVTGKVNNRMQDAQFSESFTYGTNEQAILAIGYSHAGQDYTSATISFNGSGTGAVGSFSEFRNNAISDIRMLDPGDSTVPGGLNYTFVVNNAQSGNQNQIQLSSSDIRDASDYIGQRIVIISGLGVGQYAEITGYNAETKIAIVSKESDGTNGWDHFQPGWPIESVLDSTTRYSIEPRIITEDPNFVTSNIDSPSEDLWSFISWSGDKFVAITGDDLTVSYSDENGDNWSIPQIISSAYIPKGIVYTGTKSLIIADPSVGTSDTIWQSNNGIDWSTVTMNTEESTWKSIASDKLGNVVVLGSDQNVEISNDHGDTWTLSDINGITQNWNVLVYGNNKFLSIESNGSGDVAYSTDNGENWTIVENALTPRNWINATYGNGRFVIIDNNGNTAISFDGISWQENSIGNNTSGMSYVSYGAGIFIASGDSNIISKSADGLHWRTWGNDSTVFTATQEQDWKSSAYGSSEWIIVSASGLVFNKIETGAAPVLRARITNSAVSQIVIYDPGSNLSSNPEITIFDNNNVIDAVFEVNVNNGVLSQPEMNNRGNGYFTATAIISGNGFAELYQTGKFIKISDLTAIPEPGDNLNIIGINDVLYSIVKIIEISGSDTYAATLQITPSIGVAESPDHNTSILLRKRFSQIRLTGHDFLDIGTGNQNSTRYPELYIEGESSENARQPFNEALGFGGGRVFFTSTDQDGNFKVGNLFKVEQSTGIVSVDASQFDLSGLTELSLGGIQVGITPVIIREFSIDSKFTANSNSIVPTQKAISGYIEDRITGGGSDVSTNALISGQINFTGNNLDTTSGLSIDIPVKLNVKKGYEGLFLAQQYFTRSSKQ